MKWQNKGHQFEKIAPIITNGDTEYYIWGAGVFGESFYEEYRDRINILGFIDSNQEKQNKLFCGHEVKSPETLQNKQENIKVIVSAGWTKDIFDELNQLGYVKNVDYFHIDEFMAIYMMYKHNKLSMSNLTYIITEKCTFKCKHCSGLYPYYNNPKNHKLEAIIEDLDLYFCWVDSLNVLGICGGDAMIHPEFDAILECIGEKYYKKKIYNIEIYTNAVIVPSERSLELFKKYNVFYRFTDYGQNVGNRQKISQIIKLLKENSIRYDHVKFATWYDLGYPQKTNNVEGETQLINFFDACNRRSCQVLEAGKLVYCGVAKNFSDVQYCELEKSDYFNLKFYDSSKKIELMEYMLGYSEKGYLACCQKCNGGQNINKNYVHVGIQL